MATGSANETLDKGGGGRCELDCGQGPVDDRQLRRDVSDVEVIEHRHGLVTKGVQRRHRNRARAGA